MKILVMGLPGNGKTSLSKPFSDLLGGVWINASDVRVQYDDWDYSLQGVSRQAHRIRHLADGVVMAGKIAVIDFDCLTKAQRKTIRADFVVWMDTVDPKHTTIENPKKVDYHVSQWFDDTHVQLLSVVKTWMERK